MKHEKFKAFATEDEANVFLASGDINAKSISYIDHEGIEGLVIGYTESKKTHHYRTEVESVDDVFFLGMEKAMEKVEELAEKHGGVICQDMYIHETVLIVLFLVATEQ